MEYRIELTPEARGDLDDILEWLARKAAGRKGIDWFIGLEDAVGSLGAMPERCPVAEESSRFPETVRELRYGKRSGTYRILFWVDGETVKILRILHAARRRLV